MTSILQAYPFVVALTILSAGLIAWSCHMYFRRGQCRQALWMLFCAGFLLRFVSATDPVLHPWDERYHALVAKNLMEHPLTPTLYDTPVFSYDFRQWGANHIWLHKPPLALWMMSGSMALFGTHELAVRLPSVILSSIGVWLLASLGGKLADRRTGFLAALLYAVSGPVLDLAGGRAPVDHIDATLLFWVLLGTWCGGRHLLTDRPGYLAGVGVSTGCAILTKSFPGLFILGVWGIWALLRRRPLARLTGETLVVIGIAAAIFLPWKLWTGSQWPEVAAWVTEYSLIHFTEVLEGHDHPWYFYLSQLGRRFGEGVYVALIWFGIDLIRHRSVEKAVMLVWVLTPNVIFSFAATKMPAYATLSWPAVFLVYALFCWRIRDAWTAAGEARWKRFGWATLLVALLILPVRLSVERLKIHRPERWDSPAWAEQLRGLNGLDSGGRPVVLFNTPYPIEAMFYADLTAYSLVPGVGQIMGLVDEGYVVVVMDGGAAAGLRTPELERYRNDGTGGRIVFLSPAGSG